MRGREAIESVVRHRAGGRSGQADRHPQRLRAGQHRARSDLRRLAVEALEPQDRTGAVMSADVGIPKVVDRSTFQTELDALRVREKAHTREGDAIAAARRRLPMVEVDGATPLIGARGAVTLLDAFEGRRLLIAYYFMWHTCHPAAAQCEGG